MTFQELDLLLSIYGQRQIGYSYFKDKYALQLLQYQFEQYQLIQGEKIQRIKQWELGFLMNKQPLKELAAQCGGSMLKRSDLMYFRAEKQTPFIITFHHWGRMKKHRNDSWYQTSRPGKNLVLQLNFFHDHDVQYYKLIKPKDGHLFRWISHPVCSNNRLTLAWARLDLNFETGEFLIEEIQNDWIRNAQRHYKMLCREKKRFPNDLTSFKSLSFIKKYLDEVLLSYSKMWEEAILSAAIWFAIKELGIYDIYFHSYEGGKLLKKCSPPKSLYTKLPRRFGFRKTSKAPVFIQNCRYLRKTLRNNRVEWWRLNF